MDAFQLAHWPPLTLYLEQGCCSVDPDLRMTPVGRNLKLGWDLMGVNPSFC